MLAATGVCCSAAHVSTLLCAVKLTLHNKAMYQKLQTIKRTLAAILVSSSNLQRMKRLSYLNSLDILLYSGVRGGFKSGQGAGNAQVHQSICTLPVGTHIAQAE